MGTAFYITSIKDSKPQIFDRALAILLVVFFILYIIIFFYLIVIRVFWQNKPDCVKRLESITVNCIDTNNTTIRNHIVSCSKNSSGITIRRETEETIEVITIVGNIKTLYLYK